MCALKNVCWTRTVCSCHENTLMILRKTFPSGSETLGEGMEGATKPQRIIGNIIDRKMLNEEHLGRSFNAYILSRCCLSPF